MTNKRLAGLRELMLKYGVDAYVVPSTDPHMSEYVPAFWERRKFLSGFTGSAGDVTITAEAAALFTDSRYFIQAAAELEGSGIDLMKMGLPETPSLAQWLISRLDEGQSVGIDPLLFSVSAASALEDELDAHGIALVSLEDNLVDEIWEERPGVPSAPVKIHPVEVAGETRASKLDRVARAVEAGGCDAHVVSALDAIAWLLNIRGEDVEYNPVVIGYLLMAGREFTLFTHEDKLTPEVRAELEKDVAIAPYDDFGEALAALEGGRLLIDAGTASRWLLDALDTSVEPVLGTSPVTLMKALKNAAELSGFASAHRADGVAMVRFLRWLSEAVPAGGVTELSAAARLHAFRAEHPDFRGESFETISAFGPHGAIVHYAVDAGSDVPLTPEGFYLVDSGGQYPYGTTDITRTVALGPVTDEMRRLYTLVLRGHLDLAMASFPAGTAGKQLDTIARKPLWDEGINYSHGTGHGIGAYLNVHEGPHAISYYRCTGVALQPGMVTSNEPGYYLEGAFGIRIENVLTVVEDGTPGFLAFGDFTLCPYERRAIDASLLDDAHIAHIDAYHARVRDELTPLLGEEDARWLARETAPLS